MQNSPDVTGSNLFMDFILPQDFRQDLNHILYITYPTFNDVAAIRFNLFALLHLILMLLVE